MTASTTLSIHVAGFYQTDGFPAERLPSSRKAHGRGTGDCAGDDIALGGHFGALERELEFSRTVTEGRLLLLDANEVLDGVTVDGRVNVEGFRSALARFIAPGVRQRIYGELVALEAANDLNMVDAAEILSRFMHDGMPDATRFRDAMIPVIEQACRGRKDCVIRAYGEMVDVLGRRVRRPRRFDLRCYGTSWRRPIHLPFCAATRWDISTRTWASTRYSVSTHTLSPIPESAPRCTDQHSSFTARSERHPGRRPPVFTPRADHRCSLANWLVQ